MTPSVLVDDSFFRRRMALLVSDQVPFATAIAVNKLAFDTLRLQKEGITRSFDRPHPFMKRAIYIDRDKRATKKKPQTRIEFLPTPRGDLFEDVFKPHIFGGPRGRKSTEKRLQSIGVIDRSEWIMPAFSAPRDRFGNVSPRIYNNMLRWFRAFGEGGFNVGRGRRGVHYEIIPEGRGRMIYEVSVSAKGKKRFRPRFFLAKKRPNYRMRYDFYGIAHRNAKNKAGFFADQAMVIALKSKRR